MDHLHIEADFFQYPDKNSLQIYNFRVQLYDKKLEKICRTLVLFLFYFFNFLFLIKIKMDHLHI